MYLYKHTYFIQYSNNNNNDNSRAVDVERVAKGNDVLCDLWEDLKWLEYVGFRYLLLNIQHLLNYCSPQRYTYGRSLIESDDDDDGGNRVHVTHTTRTLYNWTREIVLSFICIPRVSILSITAKIKI